MCISDPRTWELAAPTIDALSSLCLPYSTNLWIWNLGSLMCIPKNTSHNFPSRLLRVWTLWCTFTRFNSLFWLFTWFRSIVIHCSTHLAESFLMHKCVCKILTTRSVEMDTISAISRTYTFGSFKIISWILLIISGMMISFRRTGLSILRKKIWLDQRKLFVWKTRGNAHTFFKIYLL